MTASIPDFFEGLDIPETPDFFEGLDIPTAAPQNVSGQEVPDFFADIDPQIIAQKPSPTPFDVPEYTPEQLKNMTVSQRMQFIEDFQREREYRGARGFGRGALSGASFGITEKIPGLSPEEGDFLTGVGELAGSALPITGIYNIVGKPLVKLAMRSPVMKSGLQSLARLTGFGLTGAIHEGTKGVVKEGEIPTGKELLKHAGTYAAIDAAIQALGYGAAFTKAIRNIAEAEGVPVKQVLDRLWDASKNYIKSRFGRAVEGELLPEDAEVLMNAAKRAEAGGLSEEPIDITPEQGQIKGPEELKRVEYKPEEFVAEEPPVHTKAEMAEPEITPQTENKIEGVKRQDISKEGLKEQKQHLLNEIDNAIAKPNAEESTVTFDVPGDGVFNIHNNPEALQKFKTAVEKNWPDKPMRKSSQKAKAPPVSAVKGGPLITEKPKAAPKAGKAGPTLSSKPKKPTQQVPPSTAHRRPKMGKEQAVARSKIISLFRTAFKDPIRLGKIKQRNAAGIHKLWSKVTRLLRDNDIETVAHEIGHNLHTVLYGGKATNAIDQSRNITNALKPYLDELKPLALYAPWGQEGFAEFTRLYVTNPDVAREMAPKFYAKFEADVKAQYPEMFNALLEARDYYEKYLSGTPQSRIRAQTSYGNDKGKLASMIDWVKEKGNLDRLKTEFLDDVFPAKRLVAEAFGIPTSEVENLKDPRNLYRSLRVLKGAVGKGDVFVLHETFDAKTLDKINGSLRDILKQLPDEEAYREFNDYLIARRAIEKTGQNIETGIHIADALVVEKDLRPKYGDLAKQMDDYNDSLLKYARDSGLLSNEQYVETRNNNLLYAPFQRVMEAEKGGVASGAGRLQAGKPIKRMTGSTRDIIAPVESILKNTYAIIINAEKNQAGQVLAKIAKMKDVGAYVESVPTPPKLKGKIYGADVEEKIAKNLMNMGLTDLVVVKEVNGKATFGLREDLSKAIPELFTKFGAGTYPAGENIVTVFFDGKPKYYEVSPEIYEMWTKGIAPYTANIITKILRVPARTLRAGAILNPKFIQKNFIRDTWGSWLFTKYGKSIKDPVGLFIDTLYSPFAMMATSAGKKDLYVQWMKAGGSMSTMQSLDRDTVIKKLEEVRKGYKPHQIIKWLRKVAEISEEANRLSEFGKAMEVEQKTRLGREIAAFASRDLSIDFAKMGLQTKALNQIIPFFNATVQGTDKFLRTMSNPEDRKNFIPRIIGFIVIPSLIFAWLNRDDERVKEFYEEEKDLNFITFVGNTAIKIPVPFETGVMAHGITQRMYNYFISKDPEAFEKFMGSIISAMLPNVIPSLANPFIESYANKNFFTGARIVPMSQEHLFSKYQYKHGTSSTARLLGRAMAYMLGQETRSKAASPAIIDHFINSWTGGLGRMMISISDYSLESAGLSDKIPGPEQAITEKLGLSAFTARYPRASTRSIEKFYDNYAAATSKQKSLKYAQKLDLESQEDIEKGYEQLEKIYDYPSLKRAYKSIQSCQREVNNIWNDPSIEPPEKKQMVEDLYLEMIEFAKAANEDIRKHKLAD
jgi:hypothetical protein